MKLTSMSIILRAMIAGALAGVLAVIFAVTIGENSINAAIAIEEAAAAADAPLSDEAPLVSRGVQQYVGLPAAGILLGAFSGLAFGTVFAAVRHKIVAANDFYRSITMAGMAFVAIVLVPTIKYPANPPAVGDPDTVGDRTLYFFSLVLAGIVLAFGVGVFRRWCDERLSSSQSSAVTICAAVLAYTVLLLAWPSSPDSIPDGFPAGLLWEFRLQSLATRALLFAGLGLGLGVLLMRGEHESAVAESAVHNV